jgi:hypothetical protein
VNEGGFDLWANHGRKLTKKLHWKIQLNVRETREKNGLIPITVEPAGQT